MDFWETTPYLKWYTSHRRFSFTAKFCIECYEEKNTIPQTIFKPFLLSLYCHSKSEEKMFHTINLPTSILDEHSTIIPSKIYTNEEKYTLCKSLLLHMKEEEELVKKFLDIKVNHHI